MDVDAKSLLDRRDHTVDEVEHYDVAALYQQLTRVIDTPTIVSQADDITAIFSLPSIHNRKTYFSI